MYWQAQPLVDVTNYEPADGARAAAAGKTATTSAYASSKGDVARRVLLPVVRRHDPYAWKCLDDDHVHDTPFAATHDVSSPPPSPRALPAVDAVPPGERRHAAVAAAAATAVLRALPTQQEMYHDSDDAAPPAPPGQAMCSALVQFKCHQAEYAACMLLDKGQYVVVQGDRGIDIGAVIRVNTPSRRTYVEKTGVIGSVLRYATQREVDYWAADLKQAEAAACAFCQAQVQRLQLDMDIVQSEYQFDKKKLTFYYEARMRVDFVQLLHELYREFGCRIWMEKVRPRAD